MRRTAHLLAGIALMTGCGGQPAATETAVDLQPSNWNPTVTCKFATTVAAMAHH